MHPPSHPGPITDSPLFWLLLFGGMGLMLLTVIEPKFVKRQERLERMQQSRRLARPAIGAASADREPAADPSATPRWQSAKQPSLGPLKLVLGGLLLAATIGLQLRRQRAIAAYRRALAAEAERGAGA